MADVFLSYAADDRARVAPLVKLLEARGWSVWWDRALRPGETWPRVIQRELNAARCVVVVWSAHSIGSPWVRLEANRARERHNLVPVLLDNAAVPAEFAIYQSFDMRCGPDEKTLGDFGDGVAAQLRKRRLRNAGIGAGALTAALLLCAAGTCALTDRCGNWSLAARTPDASFAVVASDVQTGDESTNKLLEAFVDDVRRSLRRTAIGKVSSRAEINSLPQRLSSIELGQRLRVRYLLALSIAGNAEHLRVLAELIDTSTGYLSDDWTLSSSISGLSALNATLIRNVAARFTDDVTKLRIVSNEPAEAYNRYLEGRALLRDGSSEDQLARAQASFESILEQWPRYALAEAALCEVHLLRFETSRAPEQFRAGEEHCNRALAIDPSSGEAAVALGQLYLEQGRNSLAREAFTRAITESDTLADARMGLGSVAVAEGRNADAEREFRLAVDAEPGYWRTYTALGNFLFQTGRGTEALAQHRHAETLAQQDGVALNNIGASLYLSGQLEAAAGAWRAALELAPIAPTYSNLGAAYYLLGDFDNAVAMYERSAALGADDYRTWSNLGDARAFARRGDANAAYATAERLIERELALNSNDALARVGLAAVKAALGDTKAATDALDRALRGNTTDDWQVHYVAAVADIRLGLPADAQPHIDAAIRAGYPKVLIDLDPALRALPGNPSRGNSEATP